VGRGFDGEEDLPGPGEPGCHLVTGVSGSVRADV
jgi:hypothetical protein